MPLWNENAVAVERRLGEAVILGEGTLAALVAGLQNLTSSALSRVRVSMPDRHVPPFSFDGQELVELVGDPKRPKVRATKLLAPVAQAEQRPITLRAGGT